MSRLKKVKGSNLILFKTKIVKEIKEDLYEYYFIYCFKFEKSKK